MATPSTKKSTAKPRRGRPARLSRKAILEAGLGLLERSPDEPLTLSRIAEEVDAVPAALYRHVGSHDELLDGVLGLVLDGIRFEIRRRASWKARVRDWMTCVRAHLLRYPAVVSIIGRSGRTSPAWFDASAVLVEILERAGLRGKALAQAYLWITEVTMGCVVNEAMLPFPDQVQGALNAAPEMSADTRKRHAPLTPHVAALDSNAFFELMVEYAITAIPDVEAGTRGKEPRP
jgi:AcrR family transcriptional regulator